MRLALLAALCLTAATSGAAHAEALTVSIDQSVRLTLPGAARDIVVSNPSVVDVQLLTPNTVVLLGRAYGVTNVMVTDRSGRQIYDREVVVSSPDQNRISFYRGANIYNYACAARCERTPLPGEIDPTYKGYAPPYSDYASRAKAQADGGTP